MNTLNIVLLPSIISSSALLDSGKDVFFFMYAVLMADVF